MITCPNCSTVIKNLETKCPECGVDIAETSFSLLSVIKNLDLIIASSCLVIMVFVVSCQIVLRNFFQSGISFGDELVRHLVLWVVFLGAAVASRENRHIKIDVMAKVLPKQTEQYVSAIVAVFSTAIGLTLAYAAFLFVKEEFRGGITLTMFNMPVWIAQVIIPAGYLLISVHIALSAIIPLVWKRKK